MHDSVGLCVEHDGTFGDESPVTMSQFDVHRNLERSSARRVPYLLDVQANLLDGLSTRVVIPLVDAETRSLDPLRNLTPVVDVEGRRVMLLTQEIAGIPRALLGERVVSLEDRRYDILRAIDMLWLGV